MPSVPCPKRTAWSRKRNLAKTGGTPGEGGPRTIASDVGSALKLMRKPGGGFFALVYRGIFQKQDDNRI